MALRSDDLPRVAQLRLFAGFPESARERLLERALVQRYPKATLLFAQGDRPDFLHVLLEGGVELVGSGQGGRREAAIDILEPVDMFIPAAVLTSTPYLMSARVIEPAHVLLLPAAACAARSAATRSWRSRCSPPCRASSAAWSGSSRISSCERQRSGWAATS